MSGAAQDQRRDVAMSPEVADSNARDQMQGGRDGQVGLENQNNKASQVDFKAAASQEFHAAAMSIRQAWEAMPEITEVADNLLVEETEDGLNIKIMDQEGRPMFPEGSKYPYEATRKAIAAIAPILQQLPSQIRIAGHAAAGGTYGNPRYGAWELTSDRANAVRSILAEFGLSDDHINSVVGRSTSEPLFPNDPYQAANERIEITVLYAAPPVPAGMMP